MVFCSFCADRGVQRSSCVLLTRTLFIEEISVPNQLCCAFVFVENGSDHQSFASVENNVSTDSERLLPATNLPMINAASCHLPISRNTDFQILSIQLFELDSKGSE